MRNINFKNIILIIIFMALLVILSLVSYNAKCLISYKTNSSNKTESASADKASSMIEDIVYKKDLLKTYTRSTVMKYNDKGIPVLMYHSIGREKDNPISMPPEKFREQMQYLKDNNYNTITLNELQDFLENNKPVPEKSVVITFDDGYVDNYRDGYPILKEFGFNAVIFIITGAVDKDVDYLSSQQIKEMEKNGIDIESHTVNHEILTDLNYDDQFKTLKDSKNFLENLLNEKKNFLAYPYGLRNVNTIKAAKDAGYTMAFTTDGKWCKKQNGPLTLCRVYISSLYTLDTFIDRISNPDYKVEGAEGFNESAS